MTVWVLRVKSRLAEGKGAQVTFPHVQTRVRPTRNSCVTVLQVSTHRILLPLARSLPPALCLSRSTGGPRECLAVAGTCTQVQGCLDWAPRSHWPAE